MILAGDSHDTEGMRVRMRRQVLETDSGRLVYSVSDNPGDIAALNIHGWMAGGGMYVRESSRIAAKLGWRVINPSLPGFGGSSGARGSSSVMYMARSMVQLLDAEGIDKAVVFGHSMGGAVALKMASSHPERVLGVVYRDGAGTPAWRRTSLLQRLVGLPLEVGDLCVGRLRSNLAQLPHVGVNLCNPVHAMPAALELLNIDLRHSIEATRDRGIPMLCEWGLLDTITPSSAAHEFSSIAGVEPVWVLGAHSWMLSRPGVQARILTHHERGKAFVSALQNSASGSTSVLAS